MEKKRILVTGGLGFIGSHTVVELLNCGYHVCIVDNLGNASPKVLDRINEITGKGDEELTFIEGDLRDSALLDKVFTDFKPLGVIHFAAFKAVGESVAKPLEYYDNNLGSTITLLKTMEKHHCNLMIFSSSSCTYGENAYCHETDPIQPKNPYGQTKVMCEQIMKDFCTSNKDFVCLALRYFNPVGAHPSGLIGEEPTGIPNNIMPYLQKVALGVYPHLNVFGSDYPTPDGTGIRDYIHVVDVAIGHIAALEKAADLQGFDVMNLGTGKGHSVLELVRSFEKAFETQIPLKMCPRRDGDAAETAACVDKARDKLGWSTKFTLDDMCRDSVNWVKKNPKGYE